MPRTRRAFTDWFKRKTVKLVKQLGARATHVAGPPVLIAKPRQGSRAIFRRAVGYAVLSGAQCLNNSIGVVLDHVQ